jgi:regulator of sigma E protease
VTYVWGILGLAALVLIHEAGHFYTALAVGMRPRRFSLGFPPTIARYRRKGIEYAVGAIPLGGYVKIPGMHRPGPRDLDVHFAAALHEAPALAGPVDRVKRCLGDEGDFEGADEALAHLEEALAEKRLSPPAQKAATRGLRDIRDALSGDAYWRQAIWKRVVVIFAGPATNIVLCIVLLASVFLVGQPVAAGRTVAEVTPASPAAAAGLRPGDRIVAVDGIQTQTFEDIASVIQASRGNPLAVTVERGGRRLQLRTQSARFQQERWIFGFRPTLIYERHGPIDSLVLASEQTWEVTKAIGGAMGRLVRGSGQNEITSTVGIARETGRALEVGFRFYFQLLGLISLSLALLNLLPLLPLDGGHILFSLLEGIRRRAVAREVYERLSLVGIALLALLFVIGLSNDLGGGAAR